MQKLSHPSLLEQISASGAKESRELSHKAIRCTFATRVLFEALWGNVLEYSFNLTCDPQVLKSATESALLPCRV